MSEKSQYEALRAKVSLLQQGGIGNVFFVNGYGGLGNDGNHGRTPDQPFSTLTYAISQCVDYRHDVIIVLNYWQPAGETWPIVVNKQNIHIIGAGQRNLPWPVIHPPAPAAVAAFALSSSGQYSEIAFLTIGGGTVGGGISVGNNGTADGVWIHDCTFGHRWFGTPVAGILQLNAYTHGAERLRIERCTFLGSQGDFNGAITGNGISLEKAADLFGPEIVDNIFIGCAIGVNLVQSICAGILGNRFACVDAGNGEAITLGAACTECFADENHAMSQKATGMANSPYVDGGANAWGVNYGGELVSLAL